MNYGAIYTDEYYAWKDGRPKGTFVRNAERIMVISKHQTKNPGENAKTIIVATTDDGVQVRARSRDIIDFWDNYVDELSLVLEDDAARKTRAQLRTAFDKAHTQVLKEKVAEKLQIPLRGVTVSSYSVTVSIQTREAAKWLGVTKDEITQAVTDHMLSLGYSNVGDPGYLDTLVHDCYPDW